jgi:hypothetical protein
MKQQKFLKVSRTHFNAPYFLIRSFLLMLTNKLPCIGCQQYRSLLIYHLLVNHSNYKCKILDAFGPISIQSYEKFWMCWERILRLLLISLGWYFNALTNELPFIGDQQHWSLVSITCYSQANYECKIIYTFGP